MALDMATAQCGSKSFSSPRVQQPTKTLAGGTGKAQREGFPAGRCERPPRRRTQYFRAPGVGDHEPAVVRQHVLRKLRRDSEVEPFAPLPIFRPFTVRAKVGKARLDLDGQELAITPERHDIHPASTRKGELRQAHIAQLLEQPADPAAEQLRPFSSLGRFTLGLFRPVARVTFSRRDRQTLRLQPVTHAFAPSSCADTSSSPSSTGGRSSSRSCSAACSSATSGDVVSLRGSSSKTTVEVRGSMSTK